MGPAEKKVSWTYYTRNDAYVKARFLAKDFDTVETTGLGNFDGLFSFLLESGFFSLFDFRPDCRKRVMVPSVGDLSLDAHGLAPWVSTSLRLNTLLS